MRKTTARTAIILISVCCFWQMDSAAKQGLGRKTGKTVAVQSTPSPAPSSSLAGRPDRAKEIAEALGQVVAQLNRMQKEDWWSQHQAQATVITSGLYGLILIVMFWQTWLIRGQLRKSDDAHVFSALTTVHRRLSSHRSYRLRRYVYNEFPSHLEDAVKSTFGDQCLEEKDGQRVINLVAVKKFFQQFDNNQKKHYSQSFLTQLKTNQAYETYSALDAVEHVIVDFEIIALPHWKKIEAAKSVGDMYRVVLENSWPKIRPFIEIQKILRNEPKYKEHYLKLLKDLGILKDEREIA